MAALQRPSEAKRREKTTCCGTSFFAEMERFTCILFSLAGDGKTEKSIDQYLHWSMEASYVASGHDSNLRFARPDTPQICMGRAWEGIGYSLPTNLNEADKSPSPPKEKSLPFGRLFSFGGDGEIRTLEELLTPTRFPIVRARPTTRHLRIAQENNVIHLSACVL